MKQFLIILLWGLFYLSNASSQSPLPNVPKGEIKNCSIEGTYVPKGDFKKMFPNFLNDGQYTFDVQYVLPNANSLDREAFYGFNHFDNYEYPAFEENSNNSLINLGRIIVQFTSNPESYSMFHLDHDNYINSHFAIEYPEIFALDKDAKESYAKMNTLYKQTIANILQSKKSTNTSIVDMGSLQLNNLPLLYDDLIFQFVFIQNNTWMQDKTASSFPSHSLYKLLVKNVSGDILKTYGQAIFFEGNNGKWSRPKLTEHFVFGTTFPVAFENLINRFLNDKKTISGIITSNNALAIKLKENKNLDTILSLKNRYNIIESKKKQIIFDLAALGIAYDNTSANIQGSKEGIEGTPDIFGIGGFVTGLIMGHQQKKEMARNNQILVILKQKLNGLTAEANEFTEILSMDTTLLSDDLAFILNSKNNNDQALNSILNSILKKKEGVSNEFKQTYSSINSAALNNFYSDINSTLSSNNIQPTTTTNVASETLAITNEGSTSKKMDVCQQQATAAWYKSAEYKNYMRTKLNSDASDCKAKLIELTVQYCGDKLPSNELANMKQTAAGERKVADDLRRQTH